MDTTITVLGATGNVGSRTVARLARAGIRVRAVGRDPDRLAATVPEGVTPVVADLTDPASLAPALDGDDPRARSDEVERLLGRPATTYAQWARDHEEDFR